MLEKYPSLETLLKEWGTRILVSLSLRHFLVDLPHISFFDFRRLVELFYVYSQREFPPQKYVMDYEELKRTLVDFYNEKELNLEFEINISLTNYKIISREAKTYIDYTLLFKDSIFDADLFELGKILFPTNNYFLTGLRRLERGSKKIRIEYIDLDHFELYHPLDSLIIQILESYNKDLPKYREHINDLFRLLNVISHKDYVASVVFFLLVQLFKREFRYKCVEIHRFKEVLDRYLLKKGYHGGYVLDLGGFDFIEFKNLRGDVKMSYMFYDDPGKPCKKVIYDAATRKFYEKWWRTWVKEIRIEENTVILFTGNFKEEPAADLYLTPFFPFFPPKDNISE